jgi:hypothetical protein
MTSYGVSGGRRPKRAVFSLRSGAYLTASGLRGSAASARRVTTPFHHLSDVQRAALALPPLSHTIKRGML